MCAAEAALTVLETAEVVADSCSTHAALMQQALTQLLARAHIAAAECACAARDMFTAERHSSHVLALLADSGAAADQRTDPDSGSALLMASILALQAAMLPSTPADDAVDHSAVHILACSPVQKLGQLEHSYKLQQLARAYLLCHATALQGRQGLLALRAMSWTDPERIALIASKMIRQGIQRFCGRHAVLSCISHWSCWSIHE